MNADGSIWGQVKTTTDASYKTTTSNESLRSILISATAAGAAAATITWANGSPNLEVGTYKDSKVGINVQKDPVSGNWLYEGTKNQASWSDTYIFGNQNPVFKILNATTPSAASGAGGHDAWILALEKNGIMTNGKAIANTFNFVTAPPYLILNACAASPSLCGIYVNAKTDNDFLSQKPSN
jgi:hypothetical protein